MQKIMIIRHAEKHQHGALDQGVTEDGRASPHELTVRGWQRAAALVYLFNPPKRETKNGAIETPRSIFASDATKGSPSLRAIHTVAPLAAVLGISVNHDFAEDQETALAAAVSVAPSPVLIAWHHNHIAKLVKQIAGNDLQCPSTWPEERFDLVWVLSRQNTHESVWDFCQVAQCLLAIDRPSIR